jgi:hypothetical protein
MVEKMRTMRSSLFPGGEKYEGMMIFFVHPIFLEGLPLGAANGATVTGVLEKRHRSDPREKETFRAARYARPIIGEGRREARNFASPKILCRQNEGNEHGDTFSWRNGFTLGAFSRPAMLAMSKKWEEAMDRMCNL